MPTANAIASRAVARLTRAPDAALTYNPRVSFTAFKERYWHQYQHVAHQQAIGDALEDVARYVLTGGQTGTSRLAIFVPPRHGKSSASSVYFPAWLLSQNPDLRLILASYGATLAKRNSRQIRNLIADDRYRQQFPGTRLSGDSTAVDAWNLDNRQGGAVAVGVGGGVTGHGGHLVILDDVVKSRSEAESEVFRKKTVDWYTSDLLTRLEEPGGAVILMMTRWHTADLGGYILDNENGWRVIRLPALAEDGDALGRDPGGALWPERYGAAWLQKQRERIGEYAFASLYQQRPLPSGGGTFDTAHIDIVDRAPDDLDTVRFYDLAVTTKRTADYTAGVKLGVAKDETVYVLHVYRAQKSAPDVHQDIVQNAELDGRDVPIRLEAEKAGIMALDYLLRDPKLRGYKLDAKPPVGDKVTRAGGIASRVNNGRVKLVRGGWNRAFLDELSVFPAGAHDDQVDALSGAYDMLSTYKTPGSIRRI